MRRSILSRCKKWLVFSSSEYAIDLYEKCSARPALVNDKFDVRKSNIERGISRLYTILEYNAFAEEKYKKRRRVMKYFVWIPSASSLQRASYRHHWLAGLLICWLPTEPIWTLQLHPEFCFCCCCCWRVFNSSLRLLFAFSGGAAAAAIYDYVYYAP